MHPRSHLLLALALAGPGLPATTARALPGGYQVETMHDDLFLPVALRFAPDGRLFYLELGGRVMVYPTGDAPTASVWATLPVEATGERGLLGMAFHPSFPDSPYVYLYHTNDSPLVNRVVRMTDSAGIGTDYEVILDDLPASSDHHNGGRLAFGPDQMLYVTTGEQNDPALSQDPLSPMGKILRITSTGQAAPGNPFAPDNPVFALGVRNAFGLCFDPVSGEGYFTDNGPECDDELNFLASGANYGWGPGDSCGDQPAGTQLPMWTTTPTIAPTGICAYRGGVYPGMDGNLFFASFNDGAIRRVVLHPGAPDVADTVQKILGSPTEVVLDVTQGPDGRLWLVTSTRMLRVLAIELELAVGAPEPGHTWAAWPNPFTRAVALAPVGAAPLEALEVLDLDGRRVRGWSGPLPGTVVWDGRDRSGAEVPAGVYFARARVAGAVQTRRIVKLSR